jgi:hypothetical protein
MSTVAFDLRHPDLIAHEISAANQSLARVREVPASIHDLIEGLVDALGETDPDQWTGDPYLLLDVQRTAMRALRARAEGDPVLERRAVRLALEHLRFLFARLAEDEPVSEDRPAKDVAQWLASHLDVSQRALAALLGVHERTFQRWASDSEPSAPSGEDARRLRTVAQLAAQLRFALTGPGVIAWFARAHDELGGAAPGALLDDPAAIADLRRAARAVRGSAAT